MTETAAGAAATDAAAKGAADAEAAIAAAAEQPAAASGADQPAATAPAAEGAAARGAADAAAAIEAAGADATGEAAADPMAAGTDAAAGGTLPSSELRPDTRIAAAADRPDFPYLGVWAADAAACATVDQEGAAGYLVISTLSVRQDGELTLVEPVAMDDGQVSLPVGEETLELTMPSPDQLQLASGETLVRCTAP